ncbi:BnaCnng21320D [Brassica napus]|uniref:BnaCnng21320D protein n=1 Tax=Brassica napus TaxID=3708 RepID=A0A078ILC1_BRANA|nr:BnaCnng21320D [Brassica napus]
MSAVKTISSVMFASLLRCENDPSAGIKLFQNPDPESTNRKDPSDTRSFATISSSRNSVAPRCFTS